MSVNPSLQDLLDVQQHFGLPSPALVEKDIHVARALAAIAVLDTGPLRLVFGGGTALSRAHRLIYRMSEDIDLKIVSDKLPTRPALRQLRQVITDALLAAGFRFEPENREHRTSRNSTRYTIYRLPYEAAMKGQGALRPEIQIETAVWPLRQPTIELPVQSFYAEAFHKPPEVARISCVSVLETAAEKFVALTRRIALEGGLSADQRDGTLVRHIYDLHAIREHYDLNDVSVLIPEIMAADAAAYGNQFPLYREDPVRETLQAITMLESDGQYERSYEDFQRLMVYGKSINYSSGMATLNALADSIRR